MQNEQWVVKKGICVSVADGVPLPVTGFHLTVGLVQVSTVLLRET